MVFVVLSSKKKNAVENLVSLYTVVIGVALSVAVVKLVDDGKGLDAITLPTSLLFVAFVATLLPFYHGALRHLDDAYIEFESAVIRNGALVVDFLLLFFHALAFVVLALLIVKPLQFAWVLLVVLAIDVLWALFTYFGSSSRSPNAAEGAWGLINLVFVLAGVCFLSWQGLYPLAPFEPIRISVVTVCFSIGRTAVDYAWCGKFYFPD